MRRASKTPSIAVQRRIIGFGFLFLAAMAVVVYFANKREATERAAHPQLSHFVQDDAALMPRSERMALEEKLVALDRSGSAQLVVVLLSRLTAPSIADEALAFGRKYRVGHGARNDGLVLMIAALERKARIEVGYGLEAVVTDALSRIIIADAVEPDLNTGDVGAAATKGAARLLTLVHPEPFPMLQQEAEGVGSLLGEAFFMMLAALVVLGVLQGVLVSIPPVRRRLEASRRWRWLVRVQIIGSSGGSSSSSGGGGSGSSGGGSSGGGSFGGGGANN
jgi:uncharacterized protein